MLVGLCKRLLNLRKDNIHYAVFQLIGLSLILEIISYTSSFSPKNFPLFPKSCVLLFPVSLQVVCRGLQGEVFHTARDFQ
jgi:hypothetical protein